LWNSQIPCDPYSISPTKKKKKKKTVILLTHHLF